jgi:hypothetical protein
LEPPVSGGERQNMRIDLRFILLLLCFFLSGFAALLYETAWAREQCRSSTARVSIAPRVPVSAKLRYPVVLFVSFAPSPIYQVEQKMLHRPIESTQNSVK